MHVTSLLLVMAVGAGPLGAAPEELAPLSGCLTEEALIERIQRLKQAEWGQLGREDIWERWPTNLEPAGRDARTNEVAVAARRGRIIDGVLQCGETYSFREASGGRYRLAQVGISHAERLEESAVALAKRVVEAVAPPVDAQPSGTAAIGAPEEQRLVFQEDRQWERNGSSSEVETLLVNVKEEESSYVTTVFWARLAR
jgi:hypothetical protein